MTDTDISLAVLAHHKAEVQTLKQEVSHWKHECLMLGNGVAQVGALRDQILAQAAEIVQLRGALKWAYEAIEGESSLQEKSPITEALSTPPTALVGAIEGIREVLIGIKDQCAPGTGCKIQQSLAAYDAALKGENK